MGPGEDLDLDRATALLIELQDRGLTVLADPPAHVIVRPQALLDEETANQIRSLKPALLKLLTDPTRTRPCIRCGKFAFRLPTTCYWCRTVREGTA